MNPETPNRQRMIKMMAMGFFIAMMTAGYYFNITLVQLGLVDLGRRLLHLTEARVAAYMALFALLTCTIGLTFGYVMMRRGWSARLRFKLQIAAVVVWAQTALTFLVLLINSENAYLIWIVAAAVMMGLGIPATFAMTVDLVPVRHRGTVAGLITAAAYLAANVLPTDWTINSLANQLRWPMLAGSAAFGAVSFLRLPQLEIVAHFHRLPSYAIGRYVGDGSSQSRQISGQLLFLILLMFAIYFIDSLGFLRLLDTPSLLTTAWSASEAGPRIFLASAHLIGAFIGAIFYNYLDDKGLFLAIFGTFALVHFMYAFNATLKPWGGAALILPSLYALAVSLYTVVNFAIWADVSTPSTISFRSAIGVALSGWSATFLSTALAITMKNMGVTLVEHFQIVNAIALVFFLLVAVVIYFSPPDQLPKAQTENDHG